MSQTEPSIYQVVMPKLGLTMTEAKIIEWLASDGSQVRKGQPLFVIENEKSTVEIEAPADGRLRILTPVGVTVAVLAPVAQLEGSSAVGSHHAITPTQAAQSGGQDSGAVNQPAVQRTAARERIAASPKARAMARRAGFDLAAISGSGIRGMITAADVCKAADRPAVKASPLAQKLAAECGMSLNGISGSGVNGRIMRQDVQEAVAASQPKTAGQPQPLSGLRAVIAERLGKSWMERPQVTLTTEADASNLVAARNQLNAELASTGEKISYNTLFLALAAQALQEQPNLNVQLTENGLTQLTEVNIGCAVDTERGLLVPVVRNAAGKGLRNLNRELEAVVGRALTGRSLPDDLTGGTFTITNLGAYEVDAFTPLINPPECAILGIGRINAKPVGVNGQIVLREMVALSLSFDHRLVDGAPAARFLQRIKQLVERPFTLAL